MSAGDILFLLVLALILFFAVVAIIRGYKGIQMSKNSDTSSKKIRLGFLAVSIIHLSAGALITLCYVISGILILINI